MDNFHTVCFQDMDQAVTSPVTHLKVMRYPDRFNFKRAFRFRSPGQDYTLPIVVSEMLMADQNPVSLDTQFRTQLSGGCNPVRETGNGMPIRDRNNSGPA